VAHRSPSQSSKDSDISFRSPFRTPPGSPRDLRDSNRRSSSLEEIDNLSKNECHADNLPPKNIQEPDPPIQTDAVQIEVQSSSNDQLKKVNESATAVTQEADTGVQNDKAVIEDLDVEILEAIGIRVAQDRVLAPAISRSIAVRIEDILKKGLPKEEREKLIKSHVPPKNCTLVDPPKLNEEIKASINKTSSKRDARIVEKQKKITAVLALLGSTIVEIINISSSSNEESKS